MSDLLLAEKLITDNLVLHAVRYWNGELHRCFRQALQTRKNCYSKWNENAASCFVKILNLFLDFISQLFIYIMSNQTWGQY